MHIKAKHLFQFLLLIFGLTSHAQDSSLFKFHPVHSKVLIDTEGTLSIENILASPVGFEDLSTTKLKSNPDFWVWIQMDFQDFIPVLENSDDLYLKCNTFSYGSAYVLKNGRIKEFVIGKFDQKNDSNDPNDYDSGISLAVNDLFEGRFVYLRVKRSEAITNIANWDFGYVSSQYEYLNQYYWSKKHVKQRVPVYIFTGICAIMLFLTLAFYLYSWKKEFLFYALYTLFLLIYLCGYYLEIDVLLFGKNKLTGYWFIQSAQVTINLCYVLFVSYYLNTAVTYPGLHKVLKAIAIMLVGVFLLASFTMLTERFSWYIHLMNFQRAVMSVFALGGMIYLLLRARNKLVYFIVGGSFLYLAGALGFLFLKQRVFMISGATLEIFIFALGLTYKIQQEQKEKENLEKVAFAQKVKTLRAQINPHFVFNSLGSIQHLISEENKAGAISYLSKFSRLMRKLMENSIGDNVVLSDEIEIIKGYLQLEALRFDDSFKYEINVEDQLDPDLIEIPVFVIQPYVENAILHGLLPKEGDNKEISINFYKLEGSLICEIDDNGIGRTAAMERRSAFKTKQKSRGTEVTRERLELINTGDPDSVRIIDKTDEKGNPMGTTVRIKIPLS